MKKLLEHLMKKDYKKQINKDLGQKKVIKRKGNKLYVKCKGYGNSFNRWIDKTEFID